MTAPQSPPGMPWTPPKSPPTQELMNMIFDHLIAYHGKGNKKKGEKDHVQDCLEFIIPLLSPTEFEKLPNYRSSELKHYHALYKLLTTSKELGDEVSDMIKYNSPSSTWYSGCVEFDLHLTAPKVTQNGDQSYWAQAYSHTFGLGLRFVWSHPVDAGPAAVIKKGINIEAANLPGCRWRLNCIYRRQDEQLHDHLSPLIIWHDSLEAAEKAYQLARSADGAPPSKKSGMSSFPPTIIFDINLFHREKMCIITDFLLFNQERTKDNTNNHSDSYNKLADMFSRIQNHTY